MAAYPSMSMNVTVVVVLVFCAFMAIYGLLKILRVLSMLRMDNVTIEDIHRIYDVFKKDVQQSEEFPANEFHKDVLADFYNDAKPEDQRYLH
ncbi:MAG: hypothetical protein KKD44_13435 [Proteobacteria bacterium]|nr:hypothetical protein [Pseudomonadota bacterium]